MKLLSAIAVLFITVGVCLEPYPADAAGKYDGSVPFLCVPTAVAECVAEGECRPGTAESENLPDFFKIEASKFEPPSALFDLDSCIENQFI